MTLLANYRHDPAAPRPGEQSGLLPPGGVFGVTPASWPDRLGPVWRPAPFEIELHRLADGPTLDFGGEPIAGTWCGCSALVSEQARHGPQNWQHWPRCRECASAEQGRAER